MRAAVEPYGVVRNLTVAGDFVGVSYDVPGDDWSRQRVRQDLVPQMGRILERVFQVPGVERARLLAWRSNGTPGRIALVEVERANFSASHAVSSYPKFEIADRLP